MNQTIYRIFAQTSPGLESLLLAELAQQGFEAEEKPGGVELAGSAETLWRLCLQSRLAENVRVRLKSFVARDFHALEEGLRRLPFHAYFERGTTVAVKVNCHRSRLWHSGAVAQRTLEILGDRVGLSEGSFEEGAGRVHVRITGDAVQVSVDAGGYRLHRRGYRTAVAKASLRETLAAAMIRSFVGRVPDAAEPVLWDPFCGAGTIGIEAMHWGTGRLPGEQRSFGFQKWPTFDAGSFERVRAEAARQLSEVAPLPELRVIGSDTSEKALEAARRNAEAAGVLDACRWIAGDPQEVAAEVPEGAWILTNPPHGKRLREAGAVERLLELCEQRPDLRPCALLVGGRAKKRLPPQFELLFRAKSGGMTVTLRLLPTK